MKRSSLILSVILIVGIACSGVCGDRTDDPVTLTIETTGYGKIDGRYPHGKSISIRMIFANTGDRAETILLRDHDREGFTEDFLDGLSVRIVDSKGRVITKHDILSSIDTDAAEWFTSVIFDSEEFEVMKAEAELLHQDLQTAFGEGV